VLVVACVWCCGWVGVLICIGGCVLCCLVCCTGFVVLVAGCFTFTFCVAFLVWWKGLLMCCGISCCIDTVCCLCVCVLCVCGWVVVFDMLWWVVT